MTFRIVRSGTSPLLQAGRTDNNHPRREIAAAVSVVALGVECGNQIPFLLQTGLFRQVRLDTDAIGSVLGELLGFAVLVERLREVLGMADVHHLMAMFTAAALNTAGNDVDSADLAESSAQGENLESVLLPDRPLKVVLPSDAMCRSFAVKKSVNHQTSVAGVRRPGRAARRPRVTSSASPRIEHHCAEEVSRSLQVSTDRRGVPSRPAY